MKREPGYYITKARATAVISALACCCIIPGVVARGADPPASPQDNVSAASAAKDKITPLTEDNEVKLGRQNAEENDKHIRLVTDAAIVERVNRIGSELAAVANSVPIKPLWGLPALKQFNYTFKVVNDKDVNAYSLPGGFVYVNKGLIDYVRSDDELAGVLAHEISHCAHHHMVKLMHETSKIQNILLPALVAVLAASRARSTDTLNALNAGYLYTIAKTNTYGVEAEKDADHSGMLLMTHTKYNPLGLYSFMIRMAADEERDNHVDMGILQTHPPGEERVDAAHKLLDELKIPIELSKVDPTLKINVKLIKGSGDTVDMAEMSIRGVPLCRVVGAGKKSAEAHAWDIAKQLNPDIDDELQPFEIHVLKDKNKIAVRGVTIITQADADADGRTVEEIGKTMMDAIMLINAKKQLEAPHQ